MFMKVWNIMTLHLDTAALHGCVITLKHSEHDSTPKDTTEEAGLGELENDVDMCYIMPNDDG